MSGALFKEEMRSKNIGIDDPIETVETLSEIPPRYKLVVTAKVNGKQFRCFAYFTTVKEPARVSIERDFKRIVQRENKLNLEA